ncbi:50S ribosomal protein L29 [Candidatus Uhrbacteria bacterium]|nr:50S ribosomal protein L29 [Candidatus Uhrbacteria bacterium]
MDANTLRTKSREILAQDLKEAQARLKELRFKLSSNQLKDVRELRELKRGIARINTILAQTSKDEAGTSV